LVYDIDPVTGDPINAITERVAGTGNSGYTGDGASALLADLSLPYDGDFDPNTGNFYFFDQFACVVRRITPGGQIDTVAGDGTGGDSGDGGPALTSAFAGYFLTFA